VESTQDAEAGLITGVFGSGKSSVAVEIADVLEKRHAPYAVLDLDWLAWFGTGDDDDATVHRMLLTNLASVTANYRAVGIRFFILARAIRTRSEADGLRAMLAMPLRGGGHRGPGHPERPARAAGVDGGPGLARVAAVRNLSA